MATATRRGVLAVVTAALLLVAGALVAPSLPGPPDRAVLSPEGSDAAAAWVARILLVLSLAWLLIGMLSARTRLVRRPGAAAARATWLGSTRPWRARESTLGLLPLDRILLFVIPAGLLVATRAVQASFVSWTYVAVVLGAWLVFAVVVRVLLGRRSPYPVLAAVGGVVVLRCALVLIPLSIGGPSAYETVFWTQPWLQIVHVSFASALFMWAFVAAGWAMSRQFGPTRATGIVLAGLGSGLAVPALVIASLGIDRGALVGWAMLPFAVDTPDAAPWVAAAIGAVLIVVGLLLRRRPASVT
ncbi:hypothetical protein QL996_07815 [Planococcus sp. APC 4015]|nr:hypothetical protein [Planococcus sp. APC 4015]